MRCAFVVLLLSVAGCMTNEGPIVDPMPVRLPGAGLQGSTGEPLETAREALAAANQEIEAANLESAELLLDRATGALDRALRSADGHRLLEAVEVARRTVEAGAPELEPLVTRLRERASAVGEAAIASAERARDLAADGQLEAAASALDEVSREVRRQVGLAPLLEARERLVAGKQMLREGRLAEAQRLFERAHEKALAASAQERLAQARQELRAAASAAERGLWNRAESHLADALEHVEAVEPLALGQRLDGDIRAIASEVELALGRMDGVLRPSPRDLRQLAQETLVIG